MRRFDEWKSPGVSKKILIDSLIFPKSGFEAMVETELPKPRFPCFDVWGTSGIPATDVSDGLFDAKEAVIVQE